MQTQTIAEARELVAFAARALSGLGQAAERLSSAPGYEDERGWLAAASRRLERAIATVEGTLGEALPLPEFAAERKALGQRLLIEWAEAAEGLLLGIGSSASLQHPLVEVLFPHQKLDKVRRGGAAARSFLAEVERRRRKAYVVRLAGEPEYAFLPALLARFDDAKSALESHEAPSPVPPEELSRLRDAVLAAADALRAALQLGRLLAEAALLEHPGWFTELGLDLGPRRRAARSTPPEPS